MSVSIYLQKADQAVVAARMLVDNQQFEGAANRAYYAMFNAARAALMSVGESTAKKHASIIAKFGLRFVRDGPLSPALGRAINDAQKLRIASDYGPGQPDPDDVRSIVARAEEFVAAARAIVPHNTSDLPSSDEGT